MNYHRCIQVIAQFKTAFIVGANKYYIPLDTVLAINKPSSAMADLTQISNTTEKKIAQRLELGPSHQDMISPMLIPYKSSSSKEFQMYLSEVEIDFTLIVVAGSESVTTVLPRITNYLLRDPSKLQTLIHEVCSTFQSNKDINRMSPSYLPYLNAVLHEGLSLCPTIPDGIRQKVSKEVR